MKVLIEHYTEKDAQGQEVERWLYLESDDNQFTLKKYNGKVSIDKNGKRTEQCDTLGYFHNVQFALTRLMRMKIMQSTATNLEALLTDMKRIESEIKKTWEVELSPVAI